MVALCKTARFVSSWYVIAESFVTRSKKNKLALTWRSKKVDKQLVRTIYHWIATRQESQVSWWQHSGVIDSMKISDGRHGIDVDDSLVISLPEIGR